jgi:hypothetical protein
VETHCAKDILTAVAYRNIGVSKSTDIGGTPTRCVRAGNTEGINVRIFIMSENDTDVRTGAPLVKKMIVHEKCGKDHVDEGKYSQYNHKKHLCLHCNEFFFGTEEAVGI